MANAPRDENRTTTMLLVDDVTGLPVAAQRDSSGRLKASAVIADGTSIQKVQVTKNSGTVVGARKTINFIEGTGVTLTIADDGTDDEVDVTIAAAGGTGTVTSASVTTANGVSATVANPTTTPAFTFTLGAITPTSVNGLTITTTTGTLTIAAGKTLTANKTMSFDAADDTGSYTLPTGTKTLVATDVASLTSLGTVSTALTGVLRADAGVLSVDTDVTDLVSAASTTAQGKVELTIASEVTTGTSTSLAVTPDALAGSDYGIRLVQIQVVDGATNTAIADGVGNYRFFVPAQLNGYNLVIAHAAVVTAGTTNTTDIQLHNVTDSVDMLSTKITIDSGEKTSYTAATAPVIDTTKDDVATGDEIRIDVDAVSSTPAKGLILILGFQLP